MAITNAQQAKQMQLVKKRKDGKRPGYYGADAGFGDDDYKDAASNFQDSFNEKTSGGGTFITDQDAQRVFDARPDLKEAFDSADANAEKRRKEKELADKKRRAEEKKRAKKEKRDARRKETKAEKKARQMKLAAFERFQKLEDYVDPFGDYTTFADMTGEEAAEKAGYNVNEFGPPGQIEFEYDDSRFRDPKTGKIKDELTEMINVNEGKKDIFGRPKKPKFVEQIKPDAIPGYDFSINPVNTNFKKGLGTLTTSSGVRPNDYGLQMSKPPGFLGLATDVVRPETGLQAFNTLEEARKIQDLTTRFEGGDSSAYDEFQDYVTRNKIPTKDEPEGANRTQTDPCKGPNPPAYCNVGDEEEEVDPRTNFYGLSPRIAGSMFDFSGFADGGRAGLAEGGMPYEGGIMDLESGRQMYFLGKLVKKATRAVKKIAKSPIGKAALLYFGGNALLGKMGGLGGLKGTLFGQAGSRVGQSFIPYKEGLLTKLGLTKGGGSLMPTLKGGITLASVLPAFFSGEKKEDGFDLEQYYKTGETSDDVVPYNRIAGSEFDFYGSPKKDGGIMRAGYQEGGDAEPVAKKTMPLIDMDGKEKDYRETGGFVDMGRMERADDVPARLSKNEFVFTADAVRNAGEGDIDKGAEVMYNMMKNLESGGEVSEESQGLDGAREMFQTSQRLGEVI
jgi:hypothetical protein